MLRKTLILVLLLTFACSTSGFFNIGAKSKKKRLWEDVHGLPFEAVQDMIKKDRPDVRIVKTPQTGGITADIRDDRVRVFVDTEGNVIGRPKVA